MGNKLMAKVIVYVVIPTLIAALVAAVGLGLITLISKARPAPEVPLVHSFSFPSGNIVIIDGDKASLCYVDTDSVTVRFCESTVSAEEER